MKRVLLGLVAGLCLSPAVVNAKILPLERAYPYGQVTYGYPGTPDSGLTSNLVKPYPWSRVTIAYNKDDDTVLVGCRGNGTQTVRVWTQGHGWKLMTCIGTEPWRVVLRRITPDIPVHAYVTFR